jgi:hypothetical protein
MVAGKGALRRWLADEFRRAPPKWLVPAHDDTVDFSANPGAASALFGS